MGRWIAGIFALLLVAWPGVGHAVYTGPPMKQLAEDVSICLTNRVHDRIIGMAWVEPEADGYRVVMSMRQPSPWPGYYVYAWMDLTRASIVLGPDYVWPDNTDPSRLYAYAVPTDGYEYRAVHGGFRDEDLAIDGHRCFIQSVYQH